MSEEHVAPPSPTIGAAAAAHQQLVEGDKPSEETEREGQDLHADGDVAAVSHVEQPALVGALSLPPLELVETLPVDPNEARFLNDSTKVFRRESWKDVSDGTKAKRTHARTQTLWWGL